MSIDDAAELRERFGNIVRSRRNRMGISQEVLAEKAGLHRTYIADIERGARNPSLESISKLARALDVSLSALFSPTHSAPSGNDATPKEPGNATVDILLVEDDRDDVKLTLRAFQRANLGNRVHVVRDGAEALDYLFGAGQYAGRKLEQPHVILLDLRLPKVTGLEVLRRIKNDERTRAIPVIILTGSEKELDKAECLLLGAEAYIVKPVDFQRLSQVTPKLRLSWMLLKSGDGAQSGIA